MGKVYEYELSRNLLKISSIVFFSQLLLRVTGVITAKKGFEFVVPVLAIVWVATVVYAITLVALNAMNKR